MLGVGDPADDLNQVMNGLFDLILRLPIDDVVSRATVQFFRTVRQASTVDRFTLYSELSDRWCR